MDRDSTKPTGRNGGRRPGAGRPKGSTNALPLGAVRAFKALRHRVSDGAEPELADVAGEAFETVVAIMRGEVPDAGQATVRLRAAAMTREEVCGKVADRVADADGKPLSIQIIRKVAK